MKTKSTKKTTQTGKYGNAHKKLVYLPDKIYEALSVKAKQNFTSVQSEIVTILSEGLGINSKGLGIK